MTLTIANLSKVYSRKQVLSNVTLELKAETIYGLLGRNGAGKSTLLNIINNRSIATAGAVELDSMRVYENETCLNRLYLMSEDTLFPSQMKIKQMFKQTAAFYDGFDENFAKKMLTAFGLDANSSLRKLSTGYRSIAKLIVALAVDCDYIFLDEPVLGLDAHHRELFYQFLLETYQQKPRTFVISTHLIDEITYLIEEVIIMNEGEVIQAASTEEILQTGVAITGPSELVEAFVVLVKVLDKETFGGTMTAYVTDADKLGAELPEQLRLTPLNLQTYFIKLTKEGGQTDEI
ncbi:ATP-binding cassette domain-containing protein [Brochothrix campestris]|uniref:ABC transporter, ATP-binding protein n=1 Tax=Brochothrix campestris FSL F6-1037 TaxID=1265861 RepID=W7CDJ1_9LIST|nr:ABC transporter ATP-binding protein [Brochothrix campestris]EUJ34987.1 ABC transporter, ATP-binding protein [Brochothrix campestris FSL F6-1037]